MGETIPQATLSSSFPTGDDTYNSANFRAQYQALYQMDMLPLRPLAHSVPDLSIMVLGSDASGFHQPINFGSSYNRIEISSGDSPAMVAPSANPRYDLLYIDPSGDILIQTGIEAATPLIPTVPSGDTIPICAIYHRATTTKIVNFADQASYTGDSYIAKDLRPFLNMGASVADGSITKAKLAADCVDGTKIEDNAVDTEHLADDAVGTAEINWGSGANQVDTDEIPEGSSNKFSKRSGVMVKLNGNQSVAGTLATLEFDTETFDYANEFNTTTYTFTAAEDGVYMYSVNLELESYTGSDINSVYLKAETSGTGDQFFLLYDNIADALVDTPVCKSGLVYMQAAQTLQFQLNVNSGSTAVVDLNTTVAYIARIN